jgi:hypothetical protein
LRDNPLPDNRKRLRPKTYSVAVYLVGAILLLQAAMLVSVFWLRAMVVSVNTGLPKPSKSALLATQAGRLKTKSPSANTDADGVTRLPSLSLAAGPHMARLEVPAMSDKLAQIGTLNDEAQVFLHQNDYSSAMDLLVKAEDLDPRNPTTLKSMAETYNLANAPARSKIYWQRLVDLGPAVGTIYGVAKDHVLLLDSSRDSSPLKEPSPLDRILYVSTVEKSPVETGGGNAHFDVRASLRRKDATMPNFDQKKLQPYVIFYQQMPDGSLVPDLGQRKGSFDDTFLFWGDKTTEAFSVRYIMPVPGTPGPNNTTEGEYYGFVIGLYYDKVLQDARSEPADLCTRLALPREIE